MIRSRNTKTLGATTRALMEADFVLLTALTKGDRRLILAFERAFPAAVLCAFDEAQLAELAGRCLVAVASLEPENLERLRTLRTVLPGTPLVLLVDQDIEPQDLATLPEELDYFPCLRSDGHGSIAAMVRSALLRQGLPGPSLPLRLRPGGNSALMVHLRATLTAFRHLHRIATDLELSFRDKLRAILALGSETFGLPIAVLARIEGQRYEVVESVAEGLPLHPGATFDLPETYCERTLHAGGPVGFEHAARSEWNTHPCYRKTRLEAYIGIPVLAGGRLYGTLNFSSPTPKPGIFHPLNLELMKAMARWVGNALYREELQQERQRHLTIERGISEASRRLLHDPPDVAGALRALAGAVDSSCVCLYELCPEGGVEASYLWHAENRPHIEMSPLPWVVSEVARHGLLVLEGAETLPPAVRLFVHEAQARGLVSLVYLALRGPRGDLFGLVGFADTRPRRWSATDPALMMASEILSAHLARARAERELRLAAQVIDATSEAVLVTDAEGTIVQVNRAFSEITGYTAKEVLGSNMDTFRSPAHDERFYMAIQRALHDHGYWHGELWQQRKNGELYPQLLTINVLRDPVGRVRHYVSIFTDITSLKRTEQRLEQLAHYDLLTGLPNRVLFEDRLQQAMALAERNRRLVALLFIDLDRFKLVNDTLGHAVGDRILSEVALRLKHTIRDTDTLARISGDEFLAVLTDLPSASSAAQAAEKIIDTLAQPFVIAGQEIVMSASIGISLYPSQQVNDMESMLRAADSAMYRAKSKGRNNYSFYRGEDGHYASTWLAVTHELRRAIQNHELDLFYQPKWDVEDRVVTGVEALIRWRHPERGLLPPAEFMDIAAEGGLIITLGEWILRRACEQAAAWRKAGLGALPVAVNVAGAQLLRGDLVETVERALNDSGIEPRLLELELSENTLIRDMAETREVLQNLKDLGVRVSIDDFGTGHASISYLRQYPIDVLKIDRSFLQDVPHSHEAAELCDAIISIAGSLHMDVIAEGVERVEQLRFVRERRCRQVQGFLVSPPLSAEALPRWVENPPSLQES